MMMQCGTGREERAAVEKIAETVEVVRTSTAGTSASGPAATLARAALTWADGRLLRNGLPHQIFSGSLHYFRVHPDLWRDRLQRLADLGLNCVDTYIPWNFHQQHEGEPADFTGWRDLGRFIEIAAELGLDVILRPGPYICAEWSNGGLPAWVTRRDVTLRSSDPGFLDPVEAWFDELIPRIAPYQAANGGPVIAVQVENEYGSYGDDEAYLAWIAAQLTRHGITELLYTADGPTEVMLDGGSMPGIFTAATLGSKPQAARELLTSRRDGEPFLVAEFWNGWFDHWGRLHHVRGAANAAHTLEGIIADGGSVSLYMAHGGTNFGLWAGANHVDGELRPTITSYDSDAPIAEDGTLTEKFFALRGILAPGAGAPVSTQPALLPAQRLEVEPGADLQTALDRLAGAPAPKQPAAPSFEDLHLDAGLVRYRARVRLPAGAVSLRFERVADRALVFLDGERVGTVTGTGTIEVTGHARVAELTVLVENLGRVNYGPGLGEHKGLLGGVLVEQRRLVYGWTAEPVAFDTVGAIELGALRAAGGVAGAGAGTAFATLDLAEAADTFLALPGFTKGFVWVNGFLLGRYWNIGPQHTLYVPAPLLRTGRNELVLLELEQRGAHLELRTSPELGETEEYIEEF
jgi:beta-galactosidase